ncbi:RNA methyltransferase [Bacillus gobiensis]|uniref:TrmH family RNA methyltransferase n=1 Tax=Bacillus gobiensis TaxID=1441095 RepID=UPI003D24A79D
MKYIESAKNQKVKEWKKLHTKKERDRTNTFLVEGFHLVEEALKSEGAVKELILTDQTNLPKDLNPQINCYVVSEDAFLAISETETPQQIAGVCQMQRSPEVKGEKWLLVDAVQDPGNLGTIIRTADAAGIDGVILGKGTVDAYNSKTLRSAQGSHFHLLLEKRDLLEFTDQLKKQGISIFGTALQDAVSYNQINPSDQFALIVGNEGAGVDPELLEKSDQNLYVPIYGQSESLNVAVAAGILLYHLNG